MQMDTPHVKNERYTYPQVIVSVHLDGQKKRRSTRKDMHRISPLTTDQPWSEIYPFAAADQFFGSYFLFPTIDILHLQFFLPD